LFFIDFNTGIGVFEPRIADIPVEFQPIGNYVQNCIEQVATDGVIKIGLQGGYTDPLGAGVSADIIATDGEMVEMPPGSGVYIPYWYYMSSDNNCLGNCQFDSERPALYRKDGEPSIEGQLDTYVNDNLEACLEGFSLLADEGFTIEPQGPVDTTTSVTKNDILFIVDYPLLVTAVGSRKIEEFAYRMPIQLQNMYEQATILSNLEIDQGYIEKAMLNTLVPYTGLGEGELPPMTHATFNFGSNEQWRKSEVAQKVQTIISIYIQALQVFDARNYEEVSVVGDRIQETIYNQGYRVPGSEFSPLYNIHFSYLDWWDMYFHLNCNGELCEPESLGVDFFPYIGIQRYNFFYDISWPTLVEIEDPEAFNGQGYKFQYMLESNIRNNEPMTSEFLHLEAATATGGTQVCDFNKRNSGNISVTVKDALGEGIEDVAVTYNCAGEGCFIENTDENGGVHGQFPVCLGGSVVFTHPDYLRNEVLFSTELDKEDSVNVELNGFYDIEYDVIKYRLVKQAGSWVIDPRPLPLLKNDSVLLILERTASEGEGEFTTIADFPSEDNTIRLHPGMYKVEGTLTTDAPYVFRKQICVDRNLFGTCTGTQLIEVPLNKTRPVGGVDIPFGVTQSDLQKNKITFVVLYADLAGSDPEELELSDISIFAEMDTYSFIYRTLVFPRIT
jgi:hypothetical protein